MTAQAWEILDVVVIGAGPSGLAVARELDHQHGVEALVLDRASEPAISWRTRYDNFRLNTNGFLSHLPGQRIPLNAGRWPTRDDMVRYFDHYVQRQNITLKLGCHVNRIDRDGGAWQLDTSAGEIRSRAVVLATGNYRTPSIPPWPGLSGFSGEVVHSGDYRNAWPYRNRDVLVVGAGNSAADIAVQLVEAAAGRIWLAVRTPPHLVRRAMGPLPADVFLELFSRVPARQIDPVIRVFNRMAVGDLSAYGFNEPPLGLKATVERGRIPTLADELIDVVRAGRVEVVPAVEAVERDRVILTGGTSVAPHVIVAATGFITDLDGLVGHLGVLDDRGKPRGGGYATNVGDGMFALGYGIPSTGPLRGIRLNATPLARQIAGYLATTPSPEADQLVASAAR
jgi:cation diffusion facilitator CzcD-associated flavoprotein CzcO